MTPVAGAVIPIAALGDWVAAVADPEEEGAVVDRVEEDRAEDMVVGVVPAAEEVAEALDAALASLLDPAEGAAPDPFPEAETAPRSAASPVAAAPPPVAVRVGAW
jgi:hypothetical protein